MLKLISLLLIYCTTLYSQIIINRKWYFDNLTPTVTYDSVVAYPAQSADDGYYEAAYSALNTSPYLGNSGGTLYTAAIRFRSITIPSGAVIDSANITVYSSNNYTTSNCKFRIYGEDKDSIREFSTTADFLARDDTLTTAYYDVTASNWSTGVAYVYNVKDIIAELVASRNYTNEAIGIFMPNNGSDASSYRRFRDYDYGSIYPILKIYYHY